MPQQTTHHDAIIIGAGVCGIYMLHKLLQQNLNVTVLEAGSEPGGTWYWNRYPGARFDSESYTYGYSFDKEILQQWSWSEHFAAQPETYQYLNFVVDKLALRDHMQFDCRVERAVYDEAEKCWEVKLSDGRMLSTQFLMTAIGMLSAATLPNIEGIDEFAGEAFHTYYWPHEPVELKGKKVAVIGTGATGVQVIGAIAGSVDSLTVFQRRPNWCAPLNNSKITDEEQAKIKASYDAIFAQCKATPNGFLHGPDRRVMSEVATEERYAFWEKLYASPGFGIWLGNFRDVLMDEEANAEFSEFVASKIRQRVSNPRTADKLIPKDHGFGTRRVPMETNYYEAYNQSNVTLVDINDTPIKCINASGIETTDTQYDFDVIIYATGFDAITGAFDRIEFIGRDGQKLADKWHDGPITYLGTQVAGFPNLLTLAGPQGASVSTNFPPAIESAVEWAASLIEFMDKHNYQTVEPQAAAEAAWLEHVKEGYANSMLSNTKSWFTGYNSNVPGHDKLRHMIYIGGAPAYRDRLKEVADNNYEGFRFT